VDDITAVVVHFNHDNNNGGAAAAAAASASTVSPRPRAGGVRTGPASPAAAGGGALA